MAGVNNSIYFLKRADGKFTTVTSFMSMAQYFVTHLTMHHTIEEKMYFPLLAERMDAFKKGEKHINSHNQIHEGLDRLSALIKRFRGEPALYSPGEFRACLDSFREVLFNHLDEEINDLDPQEFKRHWTIDEMETILLH
ncbi:hypothetical protein FRC03_001035 [Tulasnella sp. 419]|nr:hypothetical protein FRC03_001035 [Tulasnella sp. 419]